ncbi:MAG: hypothetical protein V3S68_03375 [Dehalococcoidia bacterium]
MAGKGRRTASRQAELNRKRKKTTKGPSGIPATARSAADSDGQSPVAVSVGADDAELDAPEAQQGNGVQGDAVPATTRAPRPSPVARTPRGESAGQGRLLRGERPAAYLYVGAELRRIGILTGAILATLVVLAILL